MEERKVQQSLLLEWLENFKSDLGSYSESISTIKECEEVLSQSGSFIRGLEDSLLVKLARNARQADGSCLEYGLDYHLERLVKALREGIPGDPRFPERDDQWLVERTNQRDLLIQWLEDFKSKCGQSSEAQKTIKECEEALSLYHSVVGKLEGAMKVQRARNSRLADGSCLEYGLDHFLERYSRALEQGFPENSRPEEQTSFVEEQITAKDLLVEWLEDFRSKLGHYDEATPTIEECEAVLAKHRLVVDSVRGRMAVSSAREARHAQGSCLEYGLDYHLEKFTASVRIITHQSTS